MPYLRICFRIPLDVFVTVNCDERSNSRIRDIYGFMQSMGVNFDWFITKGVVVWEEKDSTTFNYIARDIFDASIAEVLRKFFRGKKLNPLLCPTLFLEKIIEELTMENSREKLFSGAERRQLKDLAEEAPIVELVIIFGQAVDNDASDIHIEPRKVSLWSVSGRRCSSR